MLMQDPNYLNNVAIYITIKDDMLACFFTLQAFEYAVIILTKNSSGCNILAAVK